jgi:peptidoglycan hydrolase CwlO-like protein
MFEDYFGEPSPICQAQTAEEVCAQLKRLVFNPAKREKIGQLGRRFVEEHCSPHRAAQTCLERLQPLGATDRLLTPHTSSGHRYYLQRFYDDREALLSLQQALQTTKVELQTSQQSAKDTQTELEAKKHTLETAQAELQTTRAELHTTQQTLQNTRAELEAKKHTLETAQAELQTTQANLHTAQQTLQSIQADLLATQANLARYQNFLPIRVLRKLRRLVKDGI